MKRVITQDDIAKKLNISRATVARALSGKNVSEQTRKKVLNAIRELGYEPNIAAGLLAQKKQKRIYCFTIGTIDEGYADQMLEGIRSVFMVNSVFDLKVFITDIKERGDKCSEQLLKFYSVVKKQKPDGILFSPLSQANAMAVSNYCELNEIPMITLDLLCKSEGVLFVGSDYYNFGLTTGAFLANLIGRKGRILVINYDDSYNLAKVRMEGFFDKLAEFSKISYKNIFVDSISYESYYEVLSQQLVKYSPDSIYAPYKMDYVIKAASDITPDKTYVFISNGINKDLENLLQLDIVKGFVTINPYKMGSIAVEKLFDYFYKPIAKEIKDEINVGCEIYIKENWVTEI